MLTLDGARLCDRADAFTYLQEKLAFPEWFGKNLDALYDMLTCLDPETRITIIEPADQTTFYGQIRQVILDADGGTGRFSFISRAEAEGASGSRFPEGYTSALTVYQTQAAIGLLKRTFEDTLSSALNLKRVSAPLFVDPATGLNDDLNGVERPVTFDVPSMNRTGAVVHSLAKWKRQALRDYHFPVGEGLYTDMNAIRRDETPDNLHSIYVDQWDWEKVITPAMRTMETLKATVETIVGAICLTNDAMKARFPQLRWLPDRTVSFVTTQELEDMYPTLTPKARETAYVREHHTACILQIGGALNSGEKHDGRAPDYDDWTLNADIIFYNPILGEAFEVSSMGIRVDAEALKRQVAAAGCEDRLKLPFHTALLRGDMPQTIGGGIGQSRLCMLILQKAHIGEVQVSLWDDETLQSAREAGVTLL